MAVSRAFRAALKYDATDRAGLATALYDAKRTVYVDTLRDLAESHGYEVDGDVNLSADVERELRAVSREHARIIADSFNRDVDEFLDRQPDAPADQLLQDFDAWAADRMDRRSERIAVHEAYEAHTDATVAFYAENGLEPDFEFGGHADDDAPVCNLCQALEATNPHPHARVLEVGIPHIGCRQQWHALVDGEQLPEELRIGGRTGGLLGADPLNMMLGGTDEAAAYVERAAVDDATP